MVGKPASSPTAKVGSPTLRDALIDKLRPSLGHISDLLRANRPSALDELLRVVNAIGLAEKNRVSFERGSCVGMIRSERLFAYGQGTSVQRFRQVVSGHVLMNTREAVHHLGQVDVIGS
jgi:hypothetical protein